MTHPPQAATSRFFISSLCAGQGPALYSASIDPATGALSAITPVDSPLQNAFFLAVNADSSRLYASDFVKEFQGRTTGAVHCLQISQTTLTPIAAQPANDTAPCYLALSLDQRSLFSAGYSQGAVTRFQLTPEAGLSEPQPAITPAPPTGAKAHCVLLHPTGTFLLSTFLALDQITCHRLSPVDHSLTLTSTLTLAAKSGPRHLAWHPSGRQLLAITENSNQVLAIAFDPQAGTLATQDIQSSLPSTFSGTSRAADILVHPSGRFVYGTNRGHHSIAAFELSPTAGLTPLGHYPTPGDAPQCIRFDPTGQFLLTALIKSHRVTVHRVDSATGQLTLIDSHLQVPSPSCLAFF